MRNITVGTRVEASTGEIGTVLEINQREAHVQFVSEARWVNVITLRVLGTSGEQYAKTMQCAQREAPITLFDEVVAMEAEMADCDAERAAMPTSGNATGITVQPGRGVDLGTYVPPAIRATAKALTYDDGKEPLVAILRAAADAIDTAFNALRIARGQ